MIKIVLKSAFKIILTAIAYVIAVMIAGGIISALNMPMPSVTEPTDTLLLKIFISGALIGATFLVLTSYVKIPRLKLLLISFITLSFNLVSVIVEGAFFVSGVITQDMIIPLILQQLIASMIIAGFISLIYGIKGKGDILNTGPKHTFIGWIWRILASMACYIALYYLFGRINYAIFTGSFYQSGLYGLNVPSAIDIIKIELIRSLLVVLSVVLIAVLGIDIKKRAILTGVISFIIGGAISIVQQIGTLPPMLLTASVIEIFFQNFITGVVLALLIEYNGKREYKGARPWAL